MYLTQYGQILLRVVYPVFFKGFGPYTNLVRLCTFVLNLKFHFNSNRTFKRDLIVNCLHFRASLISPTNQGSIREEDERDNDDEAVSPQREEIKSYGDHATYENNNVSSSHNFSTSPNVSTSHNFDDNYDAGASSTVVVSSDAENVKNSSIEIPPPVAVSVLNKKFSEVSLASASIAPASSSPSSSNKPLVTFTNQGQIL